MFYLLAIIVAVSCSVISLRTLISYTDMSLFSKVFISLVILSGWFAPLWTGAIRKFNIINGDAFSFIYTAGYALFGFVFILFSIIIIRDFFWYGLYGLGKIIGEAFPNPKNPGALYLANITVIVMAVVVSLYAFYEGTKAPKFKEVIIKSPKVVAETTIAVVTDLHVIRITPASKIEKIVESINGYNPDAIVMVGDIIDDTEGVDEQLAELKQLKAKHGIFAVLGNHEVYRGYIANRNRFIDLGFKYLHNSGEEINNNVFIAGIPDYHTSTYSKALNVDIEKALDLSDNNNYKVLLSHSPNFIDTLENNEIDLQISGHTHGGQIFPFHILVKHANNYLAGLYKVGEMNIYVSRGASGWGPPMRLFAPSEVTIIKLMPKDKK